MSAKVLVFTYKDGLLARLAHDLQIRCETFTIDRDGASIVGRFTLRSLRVDGAVERGRVAEGVLSASDRSKIEHTIVSEVLDVARHPEAVFKGTLEGDPATSRVRVVGKLALGGREVDLAPCTAELRGGRWIAEVVLVPSRWSIAPYRALAGALKLQDRVTVRVDLPDGPGITQWTGG